MRVLKLGLCAVLAGHRALAQASGDGLYARDGKGQPVSWWVALKLPMQARRGSADAPIDDTPCDCPPPTCTGLDTELRDFRARATGLCYLYADSNTPTLRHFREIGYECLGQGGDDPLSQTLRQIQNNRTDGDVYWALFNDQLNGISQTPGMNGGDNKTVCSGGDLFSAHAKGAVGFDATSGGFYLQTSTPNFPDPSIVRASREDKFIPLGCQRDNNVKFAQHVFAMSLEMPTLNQLGQSLQAARLCSGNFYHGLNASLASANLYRDGKDPERNANFSDIFHALLDPQLPVKEESPTITVPFRSIDHSGRKTDVFKPLPAEQPLVELDTTTSNENVTIIVKTPRAAVPPWALVAQTLRSDMSVASWWDGSFGIPNICAGDDFKQAANHFCLDNAAHGVVLNDDGTARYNIENLVEASWAMDSGTEQIWWHLVGGTRKDSNHAKWGLTTPRNGSAQATYVTFADLNMEGFPCSRACNGSQAGRGGSFISLPSIPLHKSFVNSLGIRACPCVASTTSDESYTSLRMCHFGCWHKLEKHFEPADLPQMSHSASSYWLKNDTRATQIRID
ncbi:hypothetical protein Poli38472_005174 [Pythium oligandrum]|uniref:C-type lectin domain-containing protein n=1 Tax=Pythium oligandrum TaxID=41045 RepID=A0A8K1CFK6_PYTOL|nr:hypothetical protein Poli38472_005174 [Pythium oligandrum]|eukprot:TMW62556.1 hypothetical protein Poli38472_005174 [Pythium oligandrum]